MEDLVDRAAERVAAQFDEALIKAYEDTRKTEDLADMETFVSFLIMDWLMSHGYLQLDGSTDINVPTGRPSAD